MVASRYPVQCRDGDHEVEGRPRPAGPGKLGGFELIELFGPKVAEDDVAVVLETVLRSFNEGERRVDTDHRSVGYEGCELGRQVSGAASDVEDVEARRDRDPLEDVIVVSTMMRGVLRVERGIPTRRARHRLIFA